MTESDCIEVFVHFPGLIARDFLSYRKEVEGHGARFVTQERGGFVQKNGYWIVEVPRGKFESVIDILVILGFTLWESQDSSL